MAVLTDFGASTGRMTLRNETATYHSATMWSQGVPEIVRDPAQVRRWQSGHHVVDRASTTDRRSSVPQRRQGAPARP